MRIYDDIFTWEGFGGVYQLAAGQCRLRIFDLKKGSGINVALLKPIMVVVSDLPDNPIDGKRMSVRSCAGHIATQVTEKFHIDHQRMVYVEYYPQSVYGDKNQYTIAAKFDAVDFTWHDGKALHPKWRCLEQPLQETLAALLTPSDPPAVE